jgi:hypothetical protein
MAFLKNKIKNKKKMRDIFAYGERSEQMCNVVTNSEEPNSIIVMVHGGAFLTGSRDKLKDWDYVVAEQNNAIVFVPSYCVGEMDTNIVKMFLYFSLIAIMLSTTIRRKPIQMLMMVSFSMLSAAILVYCATCVGSEEYDNVIKRATNDVASCIHFAKKRYPHFPICLLGHSAGAFITSSLCIDPHYLHNVGLQLSDISGVVNISGVYSHVRLKDVLISNPLVKSVFKKNEDFPISKLCTLSNADLTHIPPMFFLNCDIDFSLTRHTFDLVGACLERELEVYWKKYKNNTHFSIRKQWQGENLPISQDVKNFLTYCCLKTTKRPDFVTPSILSVG